MSTIDFSQLCCNDYPSGIGKAPERIFVIEEPYPKEFLRTVNTSHWDGDSARKPRHPSKDAEADNPKFDCEVPIFRVFSSRGTTIFQLNLRPNRALGHQFGSDAISGDQSTEYQRLACNNRAAFLLRCSRPCLSCAACFCVDFGDLAALC
jgi:hypothetical protein